MKLYDLKIVQIGNDGKNHWFTIGKIFAADDGRLEKVEIQRTDEGDKSVSKPVGFVINYPACNGIIVPTQTKAERDAFERGEDPNGPENPI
jgi:hypothetical protein